MAKTVQIFKAIQMNDEIQKICTDCRWCYAKWFFQRLGLFENEKHWCKHPNMLNLVTGELRQNCKDARGYGHLCGEKAKYFEPKT